MNTVHRQMDRWIDGYIQTYVRRDRERERREKDSGADYHLVRMSLFSSSDAMDSCLPAIFEFSSFAVDFLCLTR